MFKRRRFKTDFEISKVNVCTFCNVQEAYFKTDFEISEVSVCMFCNVLEAYVQDRF